MSNTQYVQAIETRYYGYTNKGTSRIRAKAAAGMMWVDYDQGLSAFENHRNAAIMFARKYGWGGKWIAGGSADDCGMVFVSHIDDAYAFITPQGK